MSQNGDSRIRFYILTLFFAGLFLLIISKLFYWQVVKAEALSTLGKNQSTEDITIEAKRGEILTSDGFPIATNNISYLLYINPKLVEDIDRYAQALAPLLEVEESSVSAQLRRDDLFWVKLQDRVSDLVKTKIEKLELPGIGFQQQSDRYYPEASMAAHIIGFLGKDDDGKNKGYFGVEGYYNSQMQGRNGRQYVVKDALSNPVVNDVRVEPAIHGRDISLTIDRGIQFFADKRIKEGVTRYEAEGASIIVMETKTGKILAAASAPDFNPGNYYDFDPKALKDPIVSNLYEPGSTFKVLVMAAGIDSGKIKPDTKCTICDGPVELAGFKIRTWNNKYYPHATMVEVLQHSDNTGMVFVGQKMGPGLTREYLKRFGIGELTGIDLQGEVTGELSEFWSEIDLATVTFGQGISVTPLQLVTAVNAIANKGELMKPYIVDKILTDDGKEIEVEPTVVRRVIKESSAKVMNLMMVNNVEHGESQWTKVEHYKIAGKTGTAQVPVAGHYDPNVTIASFVGFFPAEDPEITMLVLVNKPKTSIYGSETAAPIFFSVAKDIIEARNIQPSQ